MKKRKIGTSELYVTELGLGAMSLPLNEKQASHIIDKAIDCGMNFFDTADLYNNGENEKMLGKALGTKRKDIILATKVGNEMNSDGNRWTWNPSKEHIKRSVTNSLRRLNTDYIDLYQLHGGMIEDNVEETIEAFEELKQEGTIREYGISSIRPNVIQRFLKNSSARSVMMQYSLLDRRPEELFSLIDSEQSSVITRGTLAKGLLTAEGLARLTNSNGYNMYTTSELNDTLANLLKNNTDLHAAAIAFNLQLPLVATALVGARNVEQLAASIDAYYRKIPTDTLTTLTQYTAQHLYKNHRID